MIGNPHRHCWGNPQALANPRKIIMHEMNRNRRRVNSIFFEKAFVNRVKRRMDILIAILPRRGVRFCNFDGPKENGYELKHH